MAKDLKKLFNSKEWGSLIAIEEEIREEIRDRRDRLSPLGAPLEEFAKEQVHLKGGIDAISKIWKQRNDLLTLNEEPEND